MKRVNRALESQYPQSAPQYELRALRSGSVDVGYEIWQMPTRATPLVKGPVRIAGLNGRNLQLVEHRVLRQLSQSGIRLGTVASKSRALSFRLTEDLAMSLGLLFRILAPMRDRENMRRVAEGIEAMEVEEAAYWLGMAMYRKNPGRVLKALRTLLS